MKHLKITAGLLVLVQAFHLASPQDPNANPNQGPTINPDWLRQGIKAGSQNAAAADGEVAEYDQRMEHDYSSGIASGSLDTEEENGVAASDQGTNETSIVPPTIQNDTSIKADLPEVSPDTPTINSTNLSRIDSEEAGEESNSTMASQNSTGFPENHTDLPSPDLTPENNATQESTAAPDGDKGLTQGNGSSTTPAVIVTEAAPEKNSTSDESSSGEAAPGSTVKNPEAPTTVASNTSEKVNETNKGGSSGDNSERGSVSDSPKSSRKGAWGAVLGTAVAVATVGLVAYVILKKKHQKDFSHRKLVEEFPSDPVLRLDSGEPLDLNLGGSAFYNPALQEDNIQMSNFPRRH